MNIRCERYHWLAMYRHAVCRRVQRRPVRVCTSTQRDLRVKSSKLSGRYKRLPFSGRPDPSRGLARSMTSMLEVVNASSASVTGAPSASRTTRANSIRLASLGLTMMARESQGSGHAGGQSNGPRANHSRHAATMAQLGGLTAPRVAGKCGSGARTV
jgi:hypothetical protein